MLSNAREAAEYVRVQLDASEATRRHIINTEARDHLYYAGDHWRRVNVHTDGTVSAINLSAGERKALRFTVNRIRYLVQKSAASTHPTKIDAKWTPPSITPDPSKLRQVDLLESLASKVISTSRMQHFAGVANFRTRCFGNRVLGVRLCKDGDGQMLKAYQCSTSRLVLDPATEDSDLRGHDVVAFHEIWTESRIRKEFGNRVLDGESLHEIGQLASMELDANMISNGVMFGWYRNHAKTKGARVYHVFARSSSGRYDQMYQFVETAPTMRGGSTTMKRVNRANGGDNPYQGDGLPVVMLSAHKRPSGPFSDSDIEILRKDQERLNVISSLEGRILQKAAAWMVFADSGWFKNQKSAEQIREQFTNDPYTIIVGSSGGRNNYSPPQIRESPALSPGLNEKSSVIKGEMTEMAHRAPGHAGQNKSHVPDASFQRAMDEAERVHDEQIHTAIDRYSELVTVATATALTILDKPNGKKEGGTLYRALEADGFSAGDFASIKKVDTVHLVGSCRVRESSVRMRSHRARRQDLDFAVTAQIITPDQFIEAMADDLDTPLTAHHRTLRDFARTVTDKIVSDEGYVFEPIPMDPIDSGMVMREMQRAMMSSRVQSEPLTRSRVGDAIRQQAAATQEYLAMLQPPQQPEALPPADEGPGPFTETPPLDQLLGAIPSG